MRRSDASRRLDEAVRVIDAEDFIGNAPQFEAETAHGATDVQRAHRAARSHGPKTFFAQPFMKPEQIPRDKIEWTEVRRFSVMEKKVFFEVTIGLVGIAPHIATCLTKSVG